MLTIGPPLMANAPLPVRDEAESASRGGRFDGIDRTTLGLTHHRRHDARRRNGPARGRAGPFRSFRSIDYGVWQAAQTPF
jgi:hypothetical protein